MMKIYSHPYLTIHEFDESQTTSHESRINKELSAHLPDGCELISVSIAKTGASFQPCSATYIFSVREECLSREFKFRIEDLLRSDNIIVRRMTDKKKSRFRNIDVRDFIKSIELNNTDINIQCLITSTGSIRIQEVLELLELDEEKLTAPIKRECVQWQDV